jgi:hypothetical protein
MMKELEDYKWFPNWMRRYQMDFIGAMAVWGRLYQPLVAVLNTIFSLKKYNNWQDLCSGSGTPVHFLHQKLERAPETFLSDKFPQQEKEHERIRYLSTSVDINEMQPMPTHFYTMFNAFHHFDTVAQQNIIQHFRNNKADFMIVEILEPGFFNYLKIFLTTTIIQILVTPFIKPFSLKRIFFTWIIPVNLVTVTVDGLISVAKSKTAKRFRQELQSLESVTYQISIERIRSASAGLVVIRGNTIKQ